ncbi:MAG: NUDIX domain-containing protein [Chloroflexota bacterium]
MSKIVYRHKWMSLCEGQYETPFVDLQSDGVMAVPIMDNGDVLLLSEFSVAYDRQILFLPAGAIDTGENPDESANRELQEEVGYKAGRLDYLSTIYPLMKYVRGKINVYLARDLTPGKLQGDESWELSIYRVAFKEFESLIGNGELQDSNVIAALYMARSFLAKEI